MFPAERGNPASLRHVRGRCCRTGQVAQLGISFTLVASIGVDVPSQALQVTLVCALVALLTVDIALLTVDIALLTVDVPLVGVLITALRVLVPLVGVKVA